MTSHQQTGVTPYCQYATGGGFFEMDKAIYIWYIQCVILRRTLSAPKICEATDAIHAFNTWFPSYPLYVPDPIVFLLFHGAVLNFAETAAPCKAGVYL